MSFQEQIALRTMWQEARGEPADGKQAVAHVILNRLKDGRWGHTLASVCLWPHQFSGWSSARDPNFQAACELADEDNALMGLANVFDKAKVVADITEGATHYFATYIDAPAWVQGAIYCGQFGRQKFYKGVR